MIKKKFKLVIELTKSKECLISDAYTISELVKKTLCDLHVDLDGLAFDEENDECRDYIIKNEIQYIGIKDKNKVEIYEGNICIYTNQKGKHIGVVKWMNTLNAFRLVFVDREEFFFISSDNEVIGSIYKNPELLEKK